MDEQQMNCILGICCCEENCADKRRKALAEVIHHGLGHGPYTAAQIADFMLNSFDFAEKGTLEVLFKSVSKLARGADYVAGV